MKKIEKETTDTFVVSLVPDKKTGSIIRTANGFSGPSNYILISMEILGGSLATQGMVYYKSVFQGKKQGLIYDKLRSRISEMKNLGILTYDIATDTFTITEKGMSKVEIGRDKSLLVEGQRYSCYAKRPYFAMNADGTKWLDFNKQPKINKVITFFCFDKSETPEILLETEEARIEKFKMWAPIEATDDQDLLEDPAMAKNNKPD